MAEKFEQPNDENVQNETELLNDSFDENSSNKKNNLSEKFKHGFNSTKTWLKNTAKSASESVKYEIDKRQKISALNRIFESEATEYIDSLSGQTIYGIRENIDSKKILIRKKDEIICNSVLNYLGQSFRIIDATPKIMVPYTKEGNDQVLECYHVKFELIQNEKPIANTTNVTQILTIHGDNNGEANLTTVVKDQLEKLEETIRNYKPSLFGKGKNLQNQAIEMYGNFKNCIINKQKNQTLFDKFIKIVSSFLPTAVPLITALISSI